jgi:hypothetical protein
MIGPKSFRNNAFEDGGFVMRSRTYLWLAAVMVLAIAAPAFAMEHAVAGTVTRVDSAAKTIAVKMADGTEQVFKYTERTAVHAVKSGGTAAKKGALDTYLAGKEGSHVVIRYSGEGARKTATAVDDLGTDTVNVSKGTVVKADKVGHTVTVKTENGAEETYHVADNAAVDTGHGVVHGSEYAAKKGEKVAVHYTDEAGQKVARLIKHM